MRENFTHTIIHKIAPCKLQVTLILQMNRESPSDGRTEVLTNQKEAINRALAIFARSRTGIDILTEELTSPEPAPSQETNRAAEAYFDIKKRGGRLRILRG